jgi:hypothetical protein
MMMDGIIKFGRSYEKMFAFAFVFTVFLSRWVNISSTGYALGT